MVGERKLAVISADSNRQAGPGKHYQGSTAHGGLWAEVIHRPEGMAQDGCGGIICELLMQPSPPGAK